MTQRTQTELGSISKQIAIDAPPQLVYDVISTPAHIAQWWTDDAEFDATPGASGTLVWRARASTRRDHDYVVQLTIVDAVPGERFSFRWVHPEGETPSVGNSMLVTFTLAPQGDGTLLTVTEEGMREQGWEAAVLEEYYTSHDEGWTRHLANLATYANDLSGSVHHE
ncbi:MAG TPA: SRPBCC domain-containing protein [Mycobacteriales bacterium]|nr:SRPBCC domain-containing protein [Mycobacteriales bacterium]